MAQQSGASDRVVFATLRLRGPEVSVLCDGHPPLAHDGQGETVWTVAMPPAEYTNLLYFLRSVDGLTVEAHEQIAAAYLRGQYDACQFCAFHDPLSQTQCGFTDWDATVRGQMSVTPDGQSSLDRCPALHSAQ